MAPFFLEVFMSAVQIRSDMFKRVDGEIIQCIIRPKHHDAFIKLGFADSIEQLPKTRKKKVSQNGGDNQGQSNQGRLSANQD